MALFPFTAGLILADWRQTLFLSIARSHNALDGTNPQVPLAEYEVNLDYLLARLKRAGERLIWATTMSMQEERQPLRRFEDVLEYNRVARAVMERNDIPIHDLFAFTDCRPELFKEEDGLHFTEEGYRLLGESVGEVIRDALDKLDTGARKSGPGQAGPS